MKTTTTKTEAPFLAYFSSRGPQFIARDILKVYLVLILFIYIYISLGITTLHNGMILSTLSMNSHTFALASHP